MLCFSNPGEIDPKLITTFGANVKTSSSPIGFFGTGLKYAIAVTLRLGGAVTIQSGERQFIFAISKRELRGKDFNIVTMNRRALAFTTEVGKEWEPWMAFREFYCNAKDEGGSAALVESVAIPEPGMTRVYVEGLDAVWSERSRYFLAEVDPLYQDELVQIFPGASTSLFYKGICVGPLRSPAEFTYNLRTDIKLSEDRMVQNVWEAHSRIAQATINCTDRGVVDMILAARVDSFESTLDYHYSHCGKTFLDVAESRMASRAPILNQSVMACLRDRRPDMFLPAILPPTKLQAAMIQRSLDFLAKIDFHVDREIVICASLGASCLGRAMNDKIWLSHDCFDLGTKLVAGTILEEYLHLAHSVADETRTMQNLLINKLIGVGELALGEPI